MKTKGKCIYCQKVADTEDEIPSRNLFPEGIGPKKYIKVPSCRKCNQRFSLDEEWFRYFVCGLAEPYSLYARQVFFSQVKRSILKRPQIGFKLKKRMKLTEIHTKSGLYLGKATLVRPKKNDWQRFCNVLDKYIKGLVFYELKNILPDQYNIKHDIFLTKDRISNIVPRVKDFKCKIVNKDIFRYVFNFIPGSYKSVWITVFYNSVSCESLVFKEEDAKYFGNPDKLKKQGTTN